jgi:putative MFS transporter
MRIGALRIANLAGLDEQAAALWERVRLRAIVGVAVFFAAFDTFALIAALPTIGLQWQLTSAQGAALILTTFVGAAAGALLFGWIAEQLGRLTAIIWSIGLFAGASFACAFAWDYGLLLVLRVVEGVGLGGTIPVAAIYVSEFAKNDDRGGEVLLCLIAVPIGLAVATLATLWIVPSFGWPYLLVLGALPALLPLFMRRLLPESPSWLAERERDAEASTITLVDQEIEKATGRPFVTKTLRWTPSAAWSDFFGPQYLERTLTVWTMGVAASICGYAVIVALPNIYRTQLQLPPDQALGYALTAQLAGVAGVAASALLIDRMGRQRYFTMVYSGAALAFGALWLHGPSTGWLLALAGIAYLFAGAAAVGVYLYAAELYPARVRALAAGTVCASLTLAFIIGPVVVSEDGPWFIFLLGALAATAAAIVTVLIAVETSGRPLKDLSA